MAIFTLLFFLIFVNESRKYGTEAADKIEKSGVFSAKRYL